MTATIVMEGLVKQYPNGVRGVDGVDLSIAEGEFFALLGPSGCGKTTLLRTIAGLESITEGTLHIGGVDMTGAEPGQRGVAMVSQDYALFPHMNVSDNIAYPLRVRGVAKARRRRAAADTAKRLSLAELLERRPAQLSGGQQQRVGVARALATDPNILLMDEPFGAVDPIVRRELQDELLRLQAELGKTILFVTHDIEEAFRLGDEVVVLKEGGRIAQRGTPERILAEPADEFVRDFIGSDRADVQLEVRSVGGRNVVVDPDGRPVGVLGTERREGS